VKKRMLMIAGMVLLAALALPGTAVAQFYKGKTVTMIINYPPGGPTDIEGRIVARHLAAHIPGKPSVIVKNIGGAGGLIGSNYLGEVAKPDGSTFGFFTWNPVAELLDDLGLRVHFTTFKLIAGVQNPLVFYARKDTPPGIKTASDIMKTNGIKVLSVGSRNANTLLGTLSAEILGLKFTPVTGYRGLKGVETAILQNEGNMANTSLPGWRASIEPTMVKRGVVMALWQVAPPDKEGAYVRSSVIRELPTFEEFYGSVKGGKKPTGQAYEAFRALADPFTSLNRTVVLPPKTPAEPVAIMQAAFRDLWKDPAFLSEYAKVVRSEPALLAAEDGQRILEQFGSVTPQLKKFVAEFTKRVDQ
jgi:tripartite-type tricarboxylate transporter receptor subunit TctC